MINKDAPPPMISTRDWIAVQAMVQLINPTDYFTSYKQLAKKAYQAADALIEASISADDKPFTYPPENNHE